MDSEDIVYECTTRLVFRLQERLALADMPGAQVTTTGPEGAITEPRVDLHLVRVSPGEPTPDLPRGLRLRYLVSAHAPDARAAHRLLGIALSTLSEPLLRPESVGGRAPGMALRLLAPDGEMERDLWSVPAALRPAWALVELATASRARLSSLVTELPSRVGGWDAVVLPLSTLLRLEEIAQRRRERAVVARAWGEEGSRGTVVRFVGPKGTGKTLAASLLAGRLGVPLLRADLGVLIQRDREATHRALAEVLESARARGAVLLFVGCDVLFEAGEAGRGLGVGAAALLQHLDRHDGLTILSATPAELGGESFWARMDRQLAFPFPDEERRRHLWRTLLPHDVGLRLEAADVDLLARFALTGGDLRAAAEAGLVLAATLGEALRVPHLLYGLRAVVERGDRPLARDALGPYAAEVAQLDQIVRWRVLVGDGVPTTELRAVARLVPLADDEFLPALTWARRLVDGEPHDADPLLLGACLRLREGGRPAASEGEALARAPEGLVHRWRELERMLP